MIATCVTLAAIIASAAPGATVTLSGDCPGIIIAKANGVTVDASKAGIAWIEARGVTGLHWRGGAVTGMSPLGYGFRVLQSRGVTIERVRFSGMKRGVVIDRSQDIAIIRNSFAEPTIDGVNVANSQRVRVVGNVVWSFSTGLAHPDCGQLWSRAGQGITADVLIEGNLCLGNIQGFTAFNHPGRKPLGDPGFDRITIRNNIVRGTYPQAVALYDCRDCIVTGNDVASLPGALVKPGGPAVKASVNVVRSTGRLCGNVVPDVPKSLAAAVC